MIDNGKWLSVLEYATYKGKSISTVRRYIKGNRLKFKEENGKYFIWTSNYKKEATKVKESELLELKLENQRLKEKVKLQQEKIDELTMLVDLYENGQSAQDMLPELPI
jgi:hypothetical protein